PPPQSPPSTATAPLFDSADRTGASWIRSPPPAPAHRSAGRRYKSPTPSAPEPIAPPHVAPRDSSGRENPATPAPPSARLGSAGSSKARKAWGVTPPAYSKTISSDLPDLAPPLAI